MKKNMLIGLGVFSVVATSSTIIIPILVKNSLKNNNNNSIEPGKQIKNLEFKSNIQATSFGLESKKPSEAKEMITISWMFQNKDKLFENSELIISEANIGNNVTFKHNDYDLDIVINNNIRGTIYNFFPERSELFDSVVKFPLLANKVVNTLDYTNESFINSLIQYLYIQQRQALENTFLKDFLKKPTIKDNTLEWSFELDNSNNEINKINQTILSKAFWGKSWSSISSNNKFINDAKKITIYYKFEKEGRSHKLSPYKYDLVESNNSTRTWMFSTEKAQEYSYNIGYGVKKNEAIGMVINWPESINKIPVQVDRRIEAKEFRIRENQSLENIAKQIAIPEFVWNNKESILTNYDDFQYIWLIESVNYEINYTTTSIKLIVNWKGRTEKTEIRVFVDESEQIKFRGLDLIRIWDSPAPKHVYPPSSGIQKLRDTIIKDIYNEQIKAAGVDLPLKDTILAGSKDDEFYIQLHNSFAEELKYKLAWETSFKSWWRWPDFNTWKETQKELESMPRIDDIVNIKLNFKLTRTETSIGGQYAIKVLVAPESVEIVYKDNIIPTIKLNYNLDIQDRTSSVRDFIVYSMSK